MRFKLFVTRYCYFMLEQNNESIACLFPKLNIDEYPKKIIQNVWEVEIIHMSQVYPYFKIILRSIPTNILTTTSLVIIK